MTAQNSKQAQMKSRDNTQSQNSQNAQKRSGRPPHSSAVKTLTVRSLKKNKGRNLAAILAIIMTTMMFTTLFTLAQSMEKNMIQMYLHQSGTTAHSTCKSLTDSQIEAIAGHPDVKSYGKSIVLGMAENESLTGRQLEIRYASDQYAKDDFSFPEEGSMPEKESEIALDTLTLKRLGITPEIGAPVTIKWRKDITKKKVTSDTFTLCGWWEGNLSSYSSMAWVSEDYALRMCGGIGALKEGQLLGQRMMGISFENTEHIEEKTKKVLEDCRLSSLEFNTNLAYSSETAKSILAENLSVYAGMILVFLAGYLVIFNVFQISVASDIQFYGKLKTLGMTAKQIRKVILGQGALLSLAGIPLGMAAGYGLGFMLVPVFIPALGTESVVSVNPLIFAGSAVFALATVMSSCLLPARLAGKVSPVEALKYTDAPAGTKKKSRRRKNGASILRMAWANLWRSPKRTVLVTASLTLGLLLMTFFYAKNASFDIEKYLTDLAVSDFQIDDATNSYIGGYNPESRTISDSLLDRISSLKGLEKSGALYSREVSMPISQQAKDNFRNFYTKEALEEFQSYDSTFPQWKEGFDAALAGNDAPHTVYGADGPVLDAAVSENYILDGAFDTEKWEKGGYVLAIGPSIDPQENLPTYSVGETINIQGKSFTVMAVLHPLYPMTAGIRPAFDLPIILSADDFLGIWPESSPRKYYFNISDENIEKADQILSEYQKTDAPGMNITSRKSIQAQYESETRSSAVIGYSISIIIALVGILNFINSMVTAIISRKKEFAIIQSVGMTKRQLKQMLTFEGIYYAGITLTLSYLLSLPLIGILLRAMTEGTGFSTFRFTVLPLVICTPILLGFAVLIPYICFKNLERQSVNERLRAAD